MLVLSITCGIYSLSQPRWRDFSPSIGKVCEREYESKVDLKVGWQMEDRWRIHRWRGHFCSPSGLTEAFSARRWLPCSLAPPNTPRDPFAQLHCLVFDAKGGYCVNILLEHLSILIFHKVIFGVEQHGVLMIRQAPSCRKREGAKKTGEGGRGKRRRSVYLLECWELEFTTGA